PKCGFAILSSYKSATRLKFASCRFMRFIFKYKIHRMFDSQTGPFVQIAEHNLSKQGILD
ncbi:MAG: hypothetical protein OXC80_04505, partial [Gammaproteobacteria bacterium]|nr:hypothetical protein [Gammaproteobacteria bacterium]